MPLKSSTAILLGAMTPYLSGFNSKIFSQGTIRSPSVTKLRALRGRVNRLLLSPMNGGGGRGDTGGGRGASRDWGQSWHNIWWGCPSSASARSPLSLDRCLTAPSPNASAAAGLLVAGAQMDRSLHPPVIQTEVLMSCALCQHQPVSAHWVLSPVLPARKWVRRR